MLLGSRDRFSVRMTVQFRGTFVTDDFIALHDANSSSR